MISILTGLENEAVLPSAQGTWLEDHSEPPRTAYEQRVTHRQLIPEAIQYARRNISFIQ